MMKAKVPKPSKPWIANVRARRVAGNDRPRPATSPPNKVSIRTHSIIEPSWLPQTPVTL